MKANMTPFEALRKNTNCIHQVDIPIHIVGGETALITFKGIGYDGRAMGDTMPKLDQPQEFTSVPGTQKVAVPGQVRTNFNVTSSHSCTKLNNELWCAKTV